MSTVTFTIGTNNSKKIKFILKSAKGLTAFLPIIYIISFIAQTIKFDANLEKFIAEAFATKNCIYQTCFENQ